MPRCGGLTISDVYQRAIRLSVSVLIACVIGYGLILPDQGIHVEHAKEFSNGLKWSAITCIVVNAPVIGRVAQTGTERIVGTVIGGFLGFGVFSIGSLYWTPVSDGVVLSIAAAIVAFTSVTIGSAFGLENSTKLYALTFMLVTFGSDNLASRKGSLLLALTRISGISFGVLLSEITSVIIFPKSATGEALTYLRKSLKNLTELNAMAWQHGPLFRPEWQSILPNSSMSSLDDCFPVLSGHVHKDEEWLKDAVQREKHFEDECERVLMETYGFLNKVQDFLPQARSEVYMGHLRQQLCFLPGIPWLQLGRRVLPEADVQELATCIRRVARLLWAVHLSFQQGFDTNMLEMLKQQYPAQLMPELARQTQACLRDMLEAFPNAKTLPSAHLHGLISAVESLLRISDYQRRRILHHMKRSDTRSRRSRHASPRADPSDTSAASSPKARHSQVDSFSPAASTQLSGRLENRDYALGRSKSKRYEGGAPINAAALPSSSPPPATLASLTKGRGSKAEKGEKCADDDLKAPLLDSNGTVGPSQAAEASRPAYQAPKPIQADRSASPFAPVSLASTSNVAYNGSPHEVFWNLPKGLKIDVGSPVKGDPAHSYAIDMGSDEDVRAVSVRLQRIESGDLIVFPETAEGYVDKVRWYSFQFLMEELTEEIEIMHETVHTMLQKLPQPCLPT